jgi:hypothetical protein
MFRLPPRPPRLSPRNAQIVTCAPTAVSARLGLSAPHILAFLLAKFRCAATQPLGRRITRVVQFARIEGETTLHGDTDNLTPCLDS